MANSEHLEILEKGVDTWNKWREENEDVKIDLSKANLNNIYLVGANLSKVDLSYANFNDADLSTADFSDADLGSAKLIEARLDSANLSRADLSGAEAYNADFEFADLSNAILNDTDFSGANLSSTNLSDTKLNGANFSSTNLSNAILNRADLSYADFNDANLSSADLKDANLSKANLIEANLRSVTLRNTKLIDTDLFSSDLRYANLTNADLTGAKLYHSAKDSWKIDGIKCNYVYFDKDGKERSPKDRDFEPGEFEQLYRQLPTIEYIFKNGMTWIDPAIMDGIAQELRNEFPDFDIKLTNIDGKGFEPKAIFEIASTKYKEKAEKEISGRYETKINELQEAAREFALENRDLKTKNQTLEEMFGRTIKILAEPKMKVENKIYGGQVNFADKMDKITYTQTPGITQEQFNELKEALTHLSIESFTELQEITKNGDTEEVKGNRIKKILTNNGVSIAQGISASALFEVLKPILGL